MVGDKSCLVVPAAVRERAGLLEGTPMVLFETPTGIVLMTRGQLRQRVKDELSGLDLMGDLLAKRRASAAEEDSGRLSVLDASVLLSFAQGKIVPSKLNPCSTAGPPAERPPGLKSRRKSG